MISLFTIAAVMIVMDAAWLTARGAESGRVFAAIQGSPLTLRWSAAALCYIVMILGLWWFVVRRSTTWQDAAVQGAGLGALVYGTYDLTNIATLRAFPWSYGLADWLWGTVLFATAAAAAVASTAP